MPMRGESNPAEPKKTTIYGEDYILQATPQAGTRLGVCLNQNGRVEGMIDPVLLGAEPLGAPEDGHLLVLSGDSLEWAAKHVRAGDRARFEATGIRVPVADAATEKIAAFFNPLNPPAPTYQLSLLQTIPPNYPF